MIPAFRIDKQYVASMLPVDEISVVIASLGRDQLNRTLSMIDSWPVKPREIIVVLPPDGSIELKELPRSDTLFFRAGTKGQVTQRIEGFKRVTSRFTLQLDDDIALPYCSILRLLEMSLQDANVCICPVIKYDQYVEQHEDIRLVLLQLIKKVNFAIIGVSKRGRFHGIDTKSGVPIYVTQSTIADGNLDVDYASGGVSLHYTKNLVLDNYYPYSGRSDYEDLYHCFYMRQKGIKIQIAMNVFAYHDLIPAPPPQTFSNIFRKAFPVLRTYNALSGRGNARLTLWILWLALGLLVKKIGITMITVFCRKLRL